jgi:hypothetical protein
MKRGAGHPAVMAALATWAISKSYAREICWWTDKLPEESRAAADEILLSAAASGLELADLAALAAEMYEKSRQDKPDTDPGDDASFLRRRQLGGRLGGPSLPLDIGYADTVPAHIRDAVRLRDKHCQWAGRCDQPAAACQVHHTKPKSRGGKTSLRDCILLCPYHHQVMIHRLGWTLIVNPDGTTTAWNKDKTKVLHSHGPPARAG